MKAVKFGLFAFIFLVANVAKGNVSVNTLNKSFPINCDTVITHAPVKDILQIPILCYHNIHERTKKNNPFLTLSEPEFAMQMKSLFDSGYHTISPDRLYKYLKEGISLPSKSIIITFDDSHAEDYYIADPVLEHYGFRGMFFIITGYLNAKNYLTDTEIKELSQKGNAIAVHTWDHPDFTSSKKIDWRKELYYSKQHLEKIIGKRINYFAYPYGDWTYKAIDSLKHYGYTASFQLSKNQSKTEPLFTIRRIMVSANWSPSKLQTMMKKEFN
jgi:peptidoglycan/xylan/chitin deacetylase (PgdA/CDA1 family)